jgi:hypothetical protein
LQRFQVPVALALVERADLVLRHRELDRRGVISTGQMATGEPQAPQVPRATAITPGTDAVAEELHAVAGVLYPRLLLGDLERQFRAQELLHFELDPLGLLLAADHAEQEVGRRGGLTARRGRVGARADY